MVPDAFLIGLVNPPGAAVERPSIGLGTLKTVLSRGGIRSAVSYANVWYAEHVGVDLVQSLSYAHPREALFDWLFSGIAFPEFHPDHLQYFEQLMRRAQMKRNFSSQQLLELREGVGEFIDRAVERILAGRPSVVGCTSTFAQHAAALAILRRVRDADPRVITMMGGANCESVMGQTTHTCFDWVDFVVSGEAEESLVPLIKAVLEYGRAVPANCLPEGVFGPEHRKHGYPISVVGDGVPRAIVRSMKSVPVPDYEDFFGELERTSFKDRIRPGIPLETSRGCWWGERAHCTFCGLNGGSMQYRCKVPDEVLSELAFLSNKYGVFNFEAVDNILNPAYFEELFPRLARSSANYEMFFEVKADLKRHHVAQLASAGVKWVQPGIESLDARVLRLTRKGCAPWHNIALLKWFRQYGIRVMWNVLYGVPGERDDWYADQARIIPLLAHLEPCTPSQIQYCRYSPYYTDPARFGLSLVPCPSYQYVYPVSRDDLCRLAYFFDHVSDKADTGNAENGAGARDFMTALILWRRAWLAEEAPTCSLVAVDEGFAIFDTRACAIERRTPVCDLQLGILEAADDGVRRHDVLVRLSDPTAAAPTEINDAIDFLIGRRFLVEIEDRVVSVVLTAPVPLLPAESRFPGGFIAPASGPDDGSPFLAGL